VIKNPDSTFNGYIADLSEKVAPNLTGVAETLLFTLHNRVGNHNPVDFSDPIGRKIYDAIDYDFVGRFGRARDTHRTRSKVFDTEIKKFIGQHPHAAVVELGCGLETSFQRCDNGSVVWLCVDLPEAIAFRDRFINPQIRCRHVAADAFSLEWLPLVPASQPLLISIQGLLMYFPEAIVRQFLSSIFQDRRNLYVLFDTLPLSAIKGLDGLSISKNYRLPPIRWGIERRAIAQTITLWLKGKADVDIIDHRKLLPLHMRYSFLNKRDISIVKLASTYGAEGTLED